MFFVYINYIVLIQIELPTALELYMGIYINYE